MTQPAAANERSGVFLALCVHMNTVWSVVDRLVYVWDADTYKLLSKWALHTRISHMCPAGSRVWVATDDKLITVWDATQYRLERVLDLHKERIFSVTWLGSHVWTSSWDRRVFVWNSEVRASLSSC